jgi:hypothetical protein
VARGGGVAEISAGGDDGEVDPTGSHLVEREVRQ